jgi:mannose-6-phosphate isomerase-like protein (cupin superfamily)
VTRFVEKPSAELAQKVFADDDIFWNSGMILCQNAVFRSELSRFAQPLVQWATEVAGNRENDQGGDLALGKEELQRVQYGSIEKVLLEASEELAVVKLRCEWKDISSFEAYASVCRNTLAQANHCIMDSCENTTLINKGSSRLVVANSLRDTVIVNTDDAVYISDVHAQQEIKRIMDADQGVHSEFFDHAVRVYRDWGCREQIAQGSGFRIRKVTLYPGKSISSHSHMNRTENYSVVQGVLSVELAGKYRELSAGENINVRPGQIHRLFNKQDVDTVMIEVDTGADINESDMEHVLQMPSLYRLLPAFKDYLWGGDRLVTQFGKNSPYSTTAESWELSAHPAGQSVIAGGPMDGKLFGDFVNQYGRKVAGWKSSTFDRFPILIKFIDATNPLSVQIHTDDDYAFPNENEFG